MHTADSRVGSSGKDDEEERQCYKGGAAAVLSDIDRRKGARRIEGDRWWRQKPLEVPDRGGDGTQERGERWKRMGSDRVMKREKGWGLMRKAGWRVGPSWQRARKKRWDRKEI